MNSAQTCSFDPEDVYQCVHKLLIVSQIRERDRLRTNGGFYVDTADSHFQSIRRWITSESRTTLTTSLSELYTRATGLCQSVMQMRNQYASDTVEHNVFRTQAKTLFDGITRSISGLVSLKTTYQQDRHVCMRLEMLINHVCNELQMLHLIGEGKLRHESVTTLPIQYSPLPVPIPLPIHQEEPLLQMGVQSILPNINLAEDDQE